MSKSSDKYAHLESTKRVIGQLNHGNASSKSFNPIIIFILVLVIIVGGYYVYATQSQSQSSDSIEENNEEQVVEDTVEETEPGGEQVIAEEDVITEITGESDAIPKDNILYLVKEESGEYSLFITNEDINIRYDEASDADVNDPYFGLVGQGSYTQSFGIDYRDFPESIRLSEFPSEYLINKYFALVDHFITSDNKYLYVSLVHEQADDIDNDMYSNHNVVVKIDLITKYMETLWTREIGDDTYDDYFGAITFKDVVDEYIEVDLLECYNCAADSPSTVLIINEITAKDILLGDASKIVFDIEGGTVGYEENEERKESKLP